MEDFSDEESHHSSSSHGTVKTSKTGKASKALRGTSTTASTPKSKSGGASSTPGSSKQIRAPKEVPEEMRCFVCSERKAGKQKFCAKHKKDYDAMLYQATRDKKMDAFNNIMRDADKARAAIEDFDKANPPGRFRKQHIDWAAFTVKYSKELVRIKRREEEEWTFKDYRIDGLTKNMTEEQVKAGWRALLDSDLDREGEGFEATIWVPNRRKRIRDEVEKVSTSFTEGSKQLKNLKDKDKQDLKNFVHNSTDVSFRNNFFSKDDAAHRKVDSDDGEDEVDLDDDPGDQAKKRKRVDLATACPDLYNKEQESLKSISAEVQKLTEEATKVLEEAATFAAKQGEAAAFKSYVSTCKVRLDSAVAWSAKKPDDSPGDIVMPSAEPAVQAQVKDGKLEEQPATEETPKESKAPGIGNGEDNGCAEGDTRATGESSEAGGGAGASAVKQAVEASVVEPVIQTIGNKMTLRLRNIMESEGLSKMSVNDISMLRSQLEIEEEIDKILGIDEAEHLESVKRWFVGVKGAVSQMRAGLAKASVWLWGVWGQRCSSQASVMSSYCCCSPLFPTETLWTGVRQSPPIEAHTQNPAQFPLHFTWRVATAIVIVLVASTSALGRPPLRF